MFSDNDIKKKYRVKSHESAQWGNPDFRPVALNTRLKIPPKIIKVAIDIWHLLEWPLSGCKHAFVSEVSFSIFKGSDVKFGCLIMRLTSMNIQWSRCGSVYMVTHDLKSVSQCFVNLPRMCWTQDAIFPN